MRRAETVIPVAARSEVGKTASRRLRAQGKIPAVVYGRGTDPMPLTVDEDAFSKTLPPAAWYSTVLHLEVEDAGQRGEERPAVMIREVQRDLVRQQILSIDFQRISLREKLQTQVPVAHRGESPGVKEGGILEHVLYEVTVECLPADIPDHLEVDVSGLEISDSVRVRNIRVPANVRIVTPEDEVVVVISPPITEEELAAPAAPEEGVVVEEQMEPELVGEEEAEPEEPPE